MTRLDRATALAALDPERHDLLERCRAALAENVEVAWIYGSFWSPRFAPKSDLDLAVAGLRCNRDELADALTSSLGRSVDLLDLDRADPIIGFQVLAHGLVIYDPDGRAARVEGQVLAAYLDWKVARRPIEAAQSSRPIVGRPVEIGV